MKIERMRYGDEEDDSRAERRLCVGCSLERQNYCNYWGRTCLSWLLVRGYNECHLVFAMTTKLGWI